MKKVSLLFSVLALMFVSSSVFAQTATDSIKQSINTFFNAMRNGDSTFLRLGACQILSWRPIRPLRCRCFSVDENCGWLESVFSCAYHAKG